tara:strand:+ start:7081 stop:7491 length:411 start_codon:yes stop_codon:yes gene_type:complete
MFFMLHNHTYTNNNLAKNTKKSITNINTEDHFLSVLDQKKPSIIFSSMNHCPHCNMIEPEFTKLAQNKKYNKIQFMKTNGPALNIHKHVKRETNNKFKIPGYPAFLFIKDKKIHHVTLGANKDILHTKIKEFLKSL